MTAVRHLLTALALTVACSELNVANNVCYVEESGCKFRVTVLPMSSCPANQHVNDQPPHTSQVPAPPRRRCIQSINRSIIRVA